jgi:hypothetical protein
MLEVETRPNTSAETATRSRAADAGRTRTAQRKGKGSWPEFTSLTILVEERGGESRQTEPR